MHAPLRKTTGVIELARLRHPCPPTLSLSSRMLDTRYTVYDHARFSYLALLSYLSLPLCFHVVDEGTSLLVSSFTERDECRSKIPAVSSLTSSLMIKTQADGCLRSWNEECYITYVAVGLHLSKINESETLSLSLCSYDLSSNRGIVLRYAARSEEARKSVISVSRASSSGNRSLSLVLRLSKIDFGRAHHDHTPNSTGTDSERGNTRVEGNGEQWKQGGKHPAERVS